MMRLQAQNRATSFYESFSDLIFGTMAIFVLLLMIVMAVLKTDEAKRESEMQEMAQALSQAEAQREAAREQLQEVAQQLAQLEEAVQAQGLELAIAVDTTGSMQNALAHLVETITTISTVMPKIAPQFRIGIIGYRSTQPGQPGLQVFEMQQIERSAQDGGRSLQRLSQFTASLQAQSGLAPVMDAARSAMRFFSSPSAFGGYQVLFVLGDVGPYETTWEDVDTIEPQERALEHQLAGEVARWTAASDKRRIVSLFSGDLSSSAPEKARVSRQFFHRLARDSGQEENYTENPGKMLAYLLSAIVPER